VNDTLRFGRAFIDDACRMLQRLDLDAIAAVSQLLYAAKEEGHRLFLFGNGGSHSIATHLAADLGKGTKGLRPNQKLYKAISLENPAWLTALANDGERSFVEGGYEGDYAHGWDGAFVGQLENFLEPGDVVFAISASGNSRNVVNALLYGRARGARSVALVGFDGGDAARIADHVIRVPTADGEYGLVEGVFSVVHHMLYESARRFERAGARAAGAG